MALIDQIEMLGSAVESAWMSEAEAAQFLTEYSDGGLTLLGAVSALRRHRTIRDEYAQIFARAKRMVTVLTAVVSAETPQDKAYAEVALTAELDQQRAACREGIRRDLHGRMCGGGA